ncbi:MAG: ribulokinase [Spirochaetales bacterium]|nr:ribulokinase [Spirochaetales bacterium]
MNKTYTLGLDYGTGSVRAVIVATADGTQLAESTWSYAHGVDGVITDPKDSNVARQHPEDYLEGMKIVIQGALEKAGKNHSFSADKIVGLGVDTTGSSPLPVDEMGIPLAFKEDFKDKLDAMVWLWKDHTSYAEAAAITDTASKIRPNYLTKIGGTHSSEWYWAKVWHCLKVNPEVFKAAYTWVEHADWLPAVLTGNSNPKKMKRGVCTAGHKGLYHIEWGGYPETEFLDQLDPELSVLRATLPETACSLDEKAGFLTSEWAATLGLPMGIPVAIGAIDAHLGGVGAGIGEGVLVKNIGTSCCDMLVSPLDKVLPDIPGLCGIVPGSILPGQYGLEAGQSAVGDIFNWFMNIAAGEGDKGEAFKRLTAEAEALKPGQSGLIALDWMNGNRTVLVDQRLTGLFIGMTLHTSAAEMYRALIEAVAFGSRIILERFEEYGVKVDRVINCGGIPYKSPMLMQIYADVMGRTMELSASEQTAALGSAVAGAVAAGSENGGYDDFETAMKAMTGTLALTYIPNKKNKAVYDELFGLYKELHDAFGTESSGSDLYGVMKLLLEIKERTRN